MVAGLTALLIILFFGGGIDTVLLNPDMKKNVKTYVLDKEREKKILLILKETEKSQKQFHKNTKKESLKNFKDLNLNYDSKSEDFTSVLNSYFSDLESLQKSYLDNELEVRSIIEKAEWDNIMEKVMQEPDKDKAKRTFEKMSNQTHDALIKTCNELISDESEREKASKLLEEYKSNINALADKLLSLNYKSQSTIRTYSSPREDFEVVQIDILKRRKEFMNYVVDMRFQLKELVPEHNWTVMAKKLNKSLEKAGKTQ